MSIADKIETKMVELENLMNNRVHLTDPSKVVALVASVSMYWAHMNDDDKDYIDCAIDALENEREWDA